MDRSAPTKSNGTTGRAGERGAVASGHPLSSRVGRAVLDRGGNAYDAAIAVSAALTVVQPHANGLGSDFFAVVRDGGRRSVNGSGWAAAAADPDLFRRRHLGAIPMFGPLSSFMVPGLVASWQLLADRTTMPLRDLLAPAVRYAREGFPASSGLIRVATGTVSRADDDWKRIYATVRPGTVLRQPELARTLETIGNDGGDGFYHGALARAIDRDMRDKGGLLRFEDLDGYRAEWTEPYRIRYRGYEVLTTPPNSQGATALLWLRLLEPSDLTGVPEAEYVASLVRTMPVAYAHRARYIGDPASVRFPTELLARPDRDPSAPSTGAAPPGGGDTTAFSVTDGAIHVSAIQSNFMGFGSGGTVRGTGINLNNRGSYFTLDAAHHNVLRPGKRTFHTLMALLAESPTDTILLGTMGGDVQPQTNVQILTRAIDRGENLSAAIRAPRFAEPSTIYGTADRFAERGLALSGRFRPSDDPDLFGHAHGIRIGETVEIGLDPRGDALLDVPGSVP